MEELTEAVATSLEVTNFPNNPYAPHPRFSQYKIKKSSNQVQRRKRLLELQKLRRHDYLFHVRGLAEGNWSGLPSDEETEKEEVQTMEEEKEVPNQQDEVISEKNVVVKKGVNEDSVETNTQLEEPMELVLKQVVKPPKSYKNQLMMSEWLVEVPEDLVNNWLLVLCPVGKRSLVVTANGTTRAYTKSGFCVNQFPSALPGGNKQQQIKARDYTVLDTVFSEADRTFYVLDLMCWRGHPVFDSDTEFRFFWLNTKLEEVPEVKHHSSLNPYRFLALPHYVCSGATMESVMWSTLPFTPPLDGLLFYNKETHYTHGPTPLVGWLKAYMLPELLGIKVPDNYMSERPANYICMEQHLAQPLPKKKSRKKQQPMQTEIEMDDPLASGEPCPETVAKAPSARRRRNKRKKRNKKEQPMQTDSAGDTADGNVCTDERARGDVPTKNEQFAHINEHVSVLSDVEVRNEHEMQSVEERDCGVSS